MSDQPSPTNKRKVWILAGLVALSLGAAVFWWQSSARNQTSVSVEVATLGPVSRILAVNGKVSARDSVQIRSAVSGTVLDLLVDEGETLRKGDVLLRLDDSQQQAIVAQARSALEQGRIRQTQAAATYSRNRDLGSVIARSTLDDAKLTLAQAAQEVARLSALLDQATIQLSRFTVTAPMAGTVMTRSIDPGQLVDTSTALFTLADTSVLVVDADVDEAYATQIVLGQAAALQLVGNREILAGQVVFVAPRVDPATGGLAIKIGFDRPLKAPIGLTVTANIVVDQQQALTVPRSSLQGDAVFRLLADRAVLTPVKIIEWPASRLIVTSGLAEGDQVIIDSTGLSDGQPVSKVTP